MHICRGGFKTASWFRLKTTDKLSHNRLNPLWIWQNSPAFPTHEERARGACTWSAHVSQPGRATSPRPGLRRDAVTLTPGNWLNVLVSSFTCTPPTLPGGGGGLDRKSNASFRKLPQDAAIPASINTSERSNENSLPLALPVRTGSDAHLLPP